MKKIASVLFFGILCPVYIFGQGETSNWYFGNGAGIIFNNDGSVSATNDSKLNTFEGCATISDAVGNLLFYTDGVKVYDSDHEIMENGFGLYGDASSTQSALIVPKPEDPFLFYIFTVDTSVFDGDPDFGLNYSIVDMSLNNGKGAVTVKNINLLSDCSEKITAVVKDCFDQSIWVITLASTNGNLSTFNTYHAFEVNTSGVQTNAVISPFTSLSILDPRGYLKLSPDGKKMASANATQGLYLYDFDDTTGVLTNQQRINILDTNINPYGIEFSPDSRFLYVHTSNDSFEAAGHFSSLLQYDLLAADIPGSMIVLDKRPIYRGALQQGRNGKIYRTIANSYINGTPYLGVINNPNEKGDAAAYVHNAVDLKGKNGTQGLPPFVQSFFSKTELIRNADGTTSSNLALCSGDPFTLEAEHFPGAIYEWEKNGIPLNVPGNNIYEVLISDTDDAGRYSVVITLPDPKACPIVGESQIEILSVPNPSITIAKCDVDVEDTTDGITEVNLEELNDNPDLEFTYYASIADRDNENAITNIDKFKNSQAFSQTLFYKAVNSLGCINYGELHLLIDPVEIRVSPFGPLYNCDEDPNDDALESSFDLNEIANNYGGSTVLFYANRTDMSKQQNLLSNTITTEGTSIYAQVVDGTQCLGVDEIELVVNSSPMLVMEESYLLCTDSTGMTITAPDGFDSYNWMKLDGNSNGQISGDQIALIKELGTYILETSFNHYIDGEIFSCANKVSFKVVPSNRAIIDEVVVKDFSTNNTIQIEASGDGLYSYSLDGILYQESNFFDNIESGIVTIHVKDANGCGITKQDVAVMGYPKFFTPNGDGVNDFWQLSGVENLLESDAFISIYDRYGAFITQISPEDQGWNGVANTQSLPASDYWFSINLKDGREYKGHFALKR